eukprot:GAHX01001170.1.p1 GENE.GAHX01001170.1~~GAHX01001170.1.p1  ORF type:complete len:172 (+),score=48.72 GAHX01001170.1:73-588(+)
MDNDAIHDLEEFLSLNNSIQASIRSLVSLHSQYINSKTISECKAQISAFKVHHNRNKDKNLTQQLTSLNQSIKFKEEEVKRLRESNKLLNNQNKVLTNELKTEKEKSKKFQKNSKEKINKTLNEVKKVKKENIKLSKDKKENNESKKQTINYIKGLFYKEPEYKELFSDEE